MLALVACAARRVHQQPELRHHSGFRINQANETFLPIAMVDRQRRETDAGLDGCEVSRPVITSGSNLGLWSY